MPADINTEADIRRLVDAFYARVNADPLLSPIFNDILHLNWHTHMPVMYSFWESLLLGKHTYTGNPYPKHANMPVSPAHFQRWVALFHTTVDELFTGTKADEAKTKAASISTLFQAKMFRNP